MEKKTMPVAAVVENNDGLEAEIHQIQQKRNLTCHNCGLVGHFKHECHKLNRNGFNGYFSGRIPYVNIYNRNLSESEVLQNYNALKGRFGL